MSNDQLPGWIEKFLEKWIDTDLLDGIYGDLLESHNRSKISKGTWRAQIHLVWSALGFIRYRRLFKERKSSNYSITSIDMITNHFIVSLRSLFKNRLYTSINLLGLALSFGSCLLIGVYVHEELGYDTYHEKADRLYRLATYVEGASYENGIAKVSAPWGPEAEQTIPEIEASCRFVFFGRPIVSKGSERYYEGGGLWVDTTVFQMFSWHFIYGNPETALSQVNSLVLTRDLAEKYFPGEDPLGETLLFDNEQERVVTAVIENIPEQSHFHFNFLAPIAGYTPQDQGDVWIRWNQYYTYLLLREGASVSEVSTKLDHMLDLHLDEETALAYTPFLQPIQDIHLHSKLHREMSTNSDISYVYIFSIVALLMLLIAITNFINLYSARATHRAREVGVRKVIGATRRSIITQFMMEAMLISGSAAIIGVVLAHYFLPSLNLLLGRNLELTLVDFNWPTWGLFGVVVITGLMAGLYPALLLSSIKIISAIKADSESNLIRSLTSGSIKNLFRKGLVVIQFAIATFLIIAALVVNRQLRYIQQKNLGFNQDQIVVVPMSTQETINKAFMIKEELSQIPGVINVTASANRPGGSDYGVPYRAIGMPEEDQPAMRCLVVDEDFLDTYEIEMVAGRGFSKEMTTDSAAYLINETAAAQLGWENPLDHRLSMPAVDREPAPIIGVVKDFHFHSMHEPIGPLYFFIERAWYSQFSIKLNAEHVDATLSRLEEKWADFEPYHPFQYFFFDSSFGSLHAAEASTAQMIRWFTILTLFITCLGLFGLSAYTSERRMKEIGIRKVFGASMGNILLLLMREVVILITGSVLLAIPIAWIVSTDWLENFAYTINFGWSYIVVAAGLSILIALLTVSYHVIRSARRNPIRTLKYE